MTFSVRTHIAHRDYPTCPVQTRAIAGAEAADRMAGALSTYEDVERLYTKAHALWESWGDNYRAVKSPLYGEICEIMVALWKRKQGIVAAEHTMIEMERAA